jgi:hypothetical protein
MAASMKQNNSDEVLLNSGSKSIAINETPKNIKLQLEISRLNQWAMNENDAVIALNAL